MGQTRLIAIINAMFLIAGTCLGGGMLALPVMCGDAGFLPSISIMLVVWVYMTLTGLLYLEATLWLQGDVNIISLSSTFLGKHTKSICWLIYLFLAYASLIAYLSSGGKLISLGLNSSFGWSLSENMGYFIYIASFTGLLFLKSKFIGSVNSTMFFVMIALFILLIILGIPHINPSLLERSNWNPISLTELTPILLTTFSFPIVPMIVSYLKRDVKSIRLAIVGGTSITFLTYLIWLAVVLGIVPYEGTFGLRDMLTQDQAATVSLQHFLGNTLVANLANAFGFLAISTSFIGIGYGLYHFLADGLKLENSLKTKVKLALLISIPTLIFKLLFERVFYNALELSGGIGDSFLSGILPVTLIWVGRYKLNKDEGYQLLGGKSLLLLLLCFSLWILGYTIYRFFIPS